MNTLLTIDEAAAVLNVKPSWLRDAVSARTVPFTRIGGRQVRFTEAHLEAIVAAGENTPRGMQMVPTGRRRRRNTP